MKRIRWALVALFLVTTALWWLAVPAWPERLGWFPLRGPVVQYTGVLAIVGMAAAMWMAARGRWLEQRLRGLDKMYRLHKWLGIGVLAVSVLHWWWAQGSKWMVGWGWVVRPPRHPRPPREGLAGWLQEQRGLAETLGEWAFYAMGLLLVLALAKRFPYHLFAKTHRLLAPIWLLLAFHAVVLTDSRYWMQPLGVLLALALLVGTWVALMSLFRRIGATRKRRGTVLSMEAFPALGMLKTVIRLAPGWPGHAAGQFAFLTTQRSEGAHPYTIASDWHPEEGRITFITKGLGDHTRGLPTHLHEGDPVTIEGPYGRFDFNDGRPRQIWIGAGIGITPFIARLKQLEHKPLHEEVDLFHVSTEEDPHALQKLAEDARIAGVRLHVLISPRDGMLDGAHIRERVPAWREASVWFCGPPAFGDALHRDFAAQGLRDADWHQELFQMR